MYLSIVLIPLLGSIFAGLFGRKLGAQGSQFITTFGLIVTCLLSFTAFYEVGLNQSPVSIDLFSWIDSEYFSVNWGFTFDSLTVDRKSTRLNSSHVEISYAVFCLKKKKNIKII